MPDVYSRYIALSENHDISRSRRCKHRAENSQHAGLTLTLRQLLAWRHGHERGGASMDWSIQEIARLAGTTSRTLRHYDDVGLLEPSRVGGNGYRHYDERRARAAAAHPAAARPRARAARHRRGARERAGCRARPAEPPRVVTAGATTGWRGRSRRSRTTILTMEGGEQLMAENMFDGFDHTAVQGGGRAALGQGRLREERRAGGARCPPRRRRPGRQRQQQLAADWIDAAARGIAPGRRRGAGAGRAPGRVAGRHPGHAGQRARPADEGVLRRASARCTWPTSASPPTTAARRARPSCATR